MTKLDAKRKQAGKDLIQAWRRDPVKFVRDNFNVEPDKWQVEVLRVFPSQDREKMKISLQACVGPGKSAVLSWCGWNFMVCYAKPGSHPKGAAVAITSANLADNLWPEFAKWRSRSAFIMNAFEWTKSRIFAKAHPETWFLSARSWPKTADAEEQGRVLSGLHSHAVLYLIDESGDIPTAVLRAAEQGLSNCEWGKIMQAGNPTSHSGMLYMAATVDRKNWYIVCITSDPEDPMRTPRVEVEWALEQIEKYGRDNPWVMSSILGQFPPSALNTLLAPEEVIAAMNRTLRITDFNYSQKRIGVDVARFGMDSTILFPRQGLAAFTPTELRNSRTNEIASKLYTMKKEFKSEVEFVDGTGGWGAGVVDAYLQAGESAIEVNFSGKANDPRYFNKRAEMWFEMAAWIKRGGVLPKCPEMVAELSTPTYTFQNGKFRLEEKDQMKKRLGWSPDKADALGLTFAMPDMPGETDIETLLRGNNRAQVKHEWDPYADM